jgi:hypothetical protein
MFANGEENLWSNEAYSVGETAKQALESLRGIKGKHQRGDDKLSSPRW